MIILITKQKPAQTNDLGILESSQCKHHQPDTNNGYNIIN